MKLFSGKLYLFFAGVAVLALGAAVYSFSLYRDAQDQVQLLKNPQEAAKRETEELVRAVGRFMSLPKDETPTIATVTDINKLKNQPFFAKAHNEDKVLIYTKAKKAILYSPTENKIIDVASINIGTSSGKRSVAGEATSQSIKAALYNGTTTVGLTKNVERQLKEKLKNIEVVAKENAKKNDYQKTIVVILAKDKEQEAEAIAEFLGVKTAILPEGEVKPEAAEILIILGRDYNKR